MRKKLPYPTNLPSERVLDRGQRHGGHGALVAVEHGLAPARRVAQQPEGGEGGSHVEPQPDVQRRVLDLQDRGKIYSGEFLYI